MMVKSILNLCHVEQIQVRAQNTRTQSNLGLKLSIISHGPMLVTENHFSVNALRSRSRRSKGASEDPDLG